MVSSTKIPFKDLKTDLTFRDHVYTELSANVFAGAPTKSKDNLTRWKNVNYFVDHISETDYNRLKASNLAKPKKSNEAAKDKSKMGRDFIAKCLIKAKELAAADAANLQKEPRQLNQPASKPKQKSIPKPVQKRHRSLEVQGAQAGSSIDDAPVVQVEKRYRVDTELLPEIAARTLASLPDELIVDSEHHSLTFGEVMEAPTNVLKFAIGNAVKVKEAIEKINRKSKMFEL